MSGLFNWFIDLNPITQAWIATTFTWMVTALGAAMVFFFKSIKREVFNFMLGFAAGVMIAASFWSLLNPAILMAEELGMIGWVPAVAGFLSGGIFLWGVDRILPHIHVGLEESEGLPSSLHRSILLVLAITLHNIPEGLAVGVAFGAVASGLPGATITGAIALAIGIGLQNFPEGAAVSIPLRREGFSRFKSFLYGQSSAIVEPVAGVLGALLVIVVQPILPFALSFAAGAMIYVVAEELIPEARSNQETDIATIGVMIGFAIMMLLDVALG